MNLSDKDYWICSEDLRWFLDKCCFSSYMHIHYTFPFSMSEHYCCSMVLLMFLIRNDFRCTLVELCYCFFFLNYIKLLISSRENFFVDLDIFHIPLCYVWKTIEFYFFFSSQYTYFLCLSQHMVPHRAPKMMVKVRGTKQISYSFWISVGKMSFLIHSLFYILSIFLISHLHCYIDYVSDTSPSLILAVFLISHIHWLCTPPP